MIGDRCDTITMVNSNGNLDRRDVMCVDVFHKIQNENAEQR